MTGWSYTPDHESVGRWLREDPQLREELLRRARMGLVYAAATMHHRTGAMAASGRVVDHGIGGIHKDRMEVAVEFELPVSPAIVFHDAATVALDALRAAKAIIERG